MAEIEGESRIRRLALGLIALITLARLTLLFATRLELYPDEAQYWLWSRHLDLGYFSKPPMIAWLIWLTTRAGDVEPFVRLSAPLLHGVAAMALFGAGRRLYGAWAGFAAAMVYSLAPGVQLSSAVIATDAPLFCFLSLALLAYAALPEAPAGRRKLWIAAGLGAALGLAFLSKYAAAYAVGGLVLHALIDREARRAWTPAALAVAAAAFAVLAAPNIAWNAHHHFATVSHTVANADLGEGRRFDPRNGLAFLAAQFGVFGPLPFAALAGGGVWLAARRRLAAPDRLLLCLVLPPLILVLILAFVSRANANWAGAAYPPAAVLVGGWAVRWKRPRWLAAGLALQALAALVFIAAALSPKASTALGLDNSFKRARGWSAASRAIVARAKEEQGGAGLSAVAVEDRFAFNAVSYYGRGYFGHAGAPPLAMWVHEARPHNQAELEHPLTPALGDRVLAASLDGGYRGELAQDFAKTSARQIWSERLDPKRQRRLDLFIAEGFQPLPRDPKTGLPPEPAPWPPLR